jgi:hypothetical protein
MDDVTHVVEIDAPIGIRSSPSASTHFGQTRRTCLGKNV